MLYVEQEQKEIPKSSHIWKVYWRPLTAFHFLSSQVNHVAPLCSIYILAVYRYNMHIWTLSVGRYMLVWNLSTG